MNAWANAMEPIAALGNAIGPGDFSQHIPLPAEPPATDGSAIARVVLGTTAQLGRQPELLASFGIDADELDTRVGGRGAIHRGHDERGIPRVLIVAPTDDVLVTAISELSTRPLDPEGWSAF